MKCQSAGSIVGSMLGPMIPIPVLGPMIGGMVGGIIGEKIFTGIAKLFGYKKKTDQATNTPTNTPTSTTPIVSSQDIAPLAPDLEATSDPTGVRIEASYDRIPYEKMNPNLRLVKDDYEKAYQAYAAALSSGNQTLINQQLSSFSKQKARYRRALSAYLK